MAKKPKYKITAVQNGRKSARISTVRYTHAICNESGSAIFWSQSREAAEAKARTNYIQSGPKTVVETVIETVAAEE